MPEASRLRSKADPPRVFVLMHQITLDEVVVLAVMVIGCIVMWGRFRNRRGG